MNSIHGNELQDVSGGAKLRLCVQVGEFKICYDVPLPTFPPILW